MDVSWPIAGSWALAACMAIALLAWWLALRDKRTAELKAELKAAKAAERDAMNAWQDALRNGTTEEAVRAASRADAAGRRVELLRRSIGITLFLLVAACGCATPEPHEKIVRLDAHLRIVSPGETVPDYPDGETRWWLATPTGLEVMVPDFQKEGW